MSKAFPFSLAELQIDVGPTPYPDSFVIDQESAFWLTAKGSAKHLILLAPTESSLLERFQGDTQLFREGYVLKGCPANHTNGQVLRAVLPWLQPRLLGLATSVGFGDRLGLATSGHVRALQRVLQEAHEHTIQPIFAQQSIREMTRTQRTPEEVLDDATWGAFQAGWHGGLGADADHLKTTADIDACAAAGYTFYTIDPGEYVDSHVDTFEPFIVRRLVANLPWAVLESSPEDLKQRYYERNIDLEGRALRLPSGDVFCAAAKYGRAIAHIVTMFRHLESKGIPFELEVSVDETEIPTSHVEHIYIASELKRLGVRWVSLAPRYVGRFEKGIDYIGNLQELQEDLNGHAEIARVLGPYKLSLHSGSDKFSVYRLIHAATRGQVHLKTAGTSYVEALRVIAQVEPTLFREIVTIARASYAQDRASYHVSASEERVPVPEDVPDQKLASLLDDLNVRQVLHVTFGSILDRLGIAVRAALQAYEEDYSEQLEQHFYRHLKPFTLL
jgi:tagaturonate epimerase